jgi:hypothetical protein
LARMAAQARSRCASSASRMAGYSLIRAVKAPLAMPAPSF